MKAEKTFFKLKDRPSYMSILLGHKDKKVVKVLTGIRRCGKSAMLSLFSEKLLDLGVSDRQIIRMNFESLKFDDINNYKDLYKSVERQIVKNKKTYLLFDEIQKVEKWEKAVGSFLVDFDTDIYITGSNAYLLSSELSTLLSGRYVEIKILPLSFKEFLEFNTFDAKLDEAVWNKSYWTMPIEDKFNMYLKYGGMPSLTDYKFNEQRIHEILEGIYSTVIVKDVMQRNNILHQSLLQRLVKYLSQNVSSINSTNNISNYLRNEKAIEGNKKYSNKTVENYIAALENAFIFYEAKRHDIKGKEILKTNTKKYIVDTGFRNMLLGYRDTDRGHILENVIFFELIRRGFDVSIGHLKDAEIDFIAENQNEKIYFQIAETVSDKRTLEREIKPLKAIDDNHEKIILSLDKNFINSQSGIKMQNIINFLIEKR